LSPPIIPLQEESLYEFLELNGMKNQGRSGKTDQQFIDTERLRLEQGIPEWCVYHK
jgi:hypothetical protein